MTAKKTKPKFEYAVVASTMLVGGKEYRLGDPCDWPAELLEKYAYRLQPLGTHAKKTAPK